MEELKLNELFTEAELTLYEEFKEMGYERLLKEVRKKVKQHERIVAWLNSSGRDYLLPAVMALKDLCAQPGRRTDITETGTGIPTWKQVAESVGLSADRVRKWKQRTAAERDMRQMLGDQPHPKDRIKDGKDARLAYLEHSHAMFAKYTVAYFDGKEKEAERILSSAAEIFGF